MQYAQLTTLASGEDSTAATPLNEALRGETSDRDAHNSRKLEKEHQHTLSRGV
jgi:hypothetical protein